LPTWALALVAGAHPRRVEIGHLGPAPVGTFVEIAAAGGRATATGEHGRVAIAVVPTDSGASG
jgi:hypothetical protein